MGAEPAATRPSDAELVALSLKEHGRDAFSALVTRYKGLVMGRILAITGDFHLAEDLAQETFVKAFRSLSQLRKPEGFAAWLGTIARNTALSGVSGPQAAVGKPGEPEASATDGEGPGPAEGAARRDLIKRVVEQVESLPEHYRDTVYLHYLKDLTCREIAEVQGVSTGVVTSRLSRAASILREKFQQEKIEGGPE